MSKSITVKSISIIFYLFSLIFLLNFFYDSYIRAVIFSVISIPIIFYIILSCIRKRYYLYFIFVSIVSEIYYVIFLVKIFLNVSETSWRIKYDIDYYNLKSLKYILLSLLIICTIYFLCLNEKDKITSDDYKIKKYSISSLGGYIFNFVYTGVLLYYIIKLPSIGLRSYGNNQFTANTIIVLFRICFIISLMLYNYTNNIKFNTYLKYEIIVGTFIAIIFSITGYRFIFVESFMVLFFINIGKIKKIKFKNLILILFLLLVFYLALIFIKARYTNRDMINILFNHEKNLYYSLNAVLMNVHTNLHTYTSALKNLLPKALTGSMDLNSGAILVQYIAPESFKNEGITMGAFYLTEAYANYKIIGIVLVSIIMSFLFALFEKKNRSKSNLFFTCLYIFLISQMYSVIYYGSSNYLKLTLYYILFTLIIIPPYRIVLKK